MIKVTIMRVFCSSVLAAAVLLGSATLPGFARSEALTAPAGGSAGARPQKPRYERPKWRLRQRTGVTVEGLTGTTWTAVPSHTNSALTLRGLRQLGLRPRGTGLKDVHKWPAEPPAPTQWKAERFAAAFSELCPAGLGHDVSEYARIILQVSRQQGVDPSLLASIVYQQSECDAGRANSWGVGLTMLNRGMFPKELREGQYPYGLPDGSGSWRATTLHVQPTKMSRSNMLDPQTNLTLAAVQLRVLSEQCPAMDEPLHSNPHRHFVSHFVWGDEVRDAGAEDRILETRRRLLEYYHGLRAPTYARLRGLVIVSPMDGAPRIATSGLGEDREDGHRRHAGIDYLSRFGEPVRAIADGKVVYAGTDLASDRGNEESDRKVNVAPERASLVPPTSMGARGLFVEIDHAEGLHSVYAHLAAYGVRAGDHVQRGQLLGYVGRSGIRESDPHLHFGLFADGKVLDPLVAMRGLVFGPGETLREPRLPGEHAHGDGARKRRSRRAKQDAMEARLPPQPGSPLKLP